MPGHGIDKATAPVVRRGCFPYWWRVSRIAFRQSQIFTWSGLGVGALLGIASAFAPAFIAKQSLREVRLMIGYIAAIFGGAMVVAFVVELIRAPAKMDAELRAQASIAHDAEEDAAFWRRQEYRVKVLASLMERYQSLKADEAQRSGDPNWWDLPPIPVPWEWYRQEILKLGQDWDPEKVRRIEKTGNRED